MTFDEMYRMECDYRNIEDVYQVIADIHPYRLMKQIKAEREYLINELVDVSYHGISEITEYLLEDINDAKEIKKIIRSELLEELQMKYDEFISKCKEDK